MKTYYSKPRLVLEPDPPQPGPMTSPHAHHRFKCCKLKMKTNTDRRERNVEPTARRKCVLGSPAPCALASVMIARYTVALSVYATTSKRSRAKPALLSIPRERIRLGVFHNLILRALVSSTFVVTFRCGARRRVIHKTAQTTRRQPQPVRRRIPTAAALRTLEWRVGVWTESDPFAYAYLRPIL